MAFGTPTDRGTNTEAVSDTSIAISPSGSIAVNSIALLVFGLDNLNDTDNAASTRSSVADNLGNTWNVGIEWTCNPGAASATGAIAGLAWARVLNEITITDAVTLDINSAVTAKVIGLSDFTVGAGKTVSIVGSAGSHAHAGGGYTVTVSGLVSESHLWIGASVREFDVTATLPQDAAYTSIHGVSNISSGESGGSTQVVMKPGYRIVTGTSDTYDAGGGTSSDAAHILVAFAEVDAATPKPHIHNWNIRRSLRPA
jgi:hypothetical protein